MDSSNAFLAFIGSFCLATKSTAYDVWTGVCERRGRTAVVTVPGRCGWWVWRFVRCGVNGLGEVVRRLVCKVPVCGGSLRKPLALPDSVRWVRSTVRRRSRASGGVQVTCAAMAPLRGRSSRAEARAPATNTTMATAGSTKCTHLIILSLVLGLGWRHERKRGGPR